MSSKKKSDETNPREISHREKQTVRLLAGGNGQGKLALSKQSIPTSSEHKLKSGMRAAKLTDD